MNGRGRFRKGMHPRCRHSGARANRPVAVALQAALAQLEIGEIDCQERIVRVAGESVAGALFCRFLMQTAQHS